MNIYDILRDLIIYESEVIPKDPDFLKEFSPFLVQRWLSMHSPEYGFILNNSTNMFAEVLEDKKYWYNYFKVLLPKHKYLKIKYIKKIKKEKKVNNDELLAILADHYEMSKKEIENYIEVANIDIKRLEKEFVTGE